MRSVHVHSLRLADNSEVLVARVLEEDGRKGYGCSLTLDATAARHMAERNAQSGDEMAEVPAEVRAAMASIRWLPI